MKSVAVIGSGASGLAAALAAANGGAKVTVYEREPKVGGTTALSGGNAWMCGHDGLPGRQRRARADLPARALARRRRRRVAAGLRARAPARPRRGVERDTPLRLQAIPYCDYHAERPGGREQGGRTLEPVAVRPVAARSPRWCATRPTSPAPITYVELASGEYDREELKRRREQGTLTLGRALVAGLLQACLDAGVEVRTGERVRSRPDADAVVIATGGFERDGELARAFLRGPMLAPVGAPGAQGDGLRLAMGAGAALGCMSEAWWCPAISIPGETIDGAPMFRLILTERARAGLADRRLDRPPLRQRGPELQRPRPRAAGLRPRALRVPPRPGVADLRRHLPRDVPARPAQPPRSRPRVAGARRPTSRAWRSRSTSRRRRSRRPSRASTRGAARGRGPGLRPRLLPLRPLHRRARPARARPVLRAARPARLPEHQGRAAHRRRRPRAGHRGRLADRRALRRRQRGRERLRARLPGRGRDARARARVRLPGG